MRVRYLGGAPDARRTRIIRWDDIEILQLVDGFQEEQGLPLWDGEHLLDRAGGRHTADKAERAALGRELLLAREAGLIQFDIRPHMGEHQPPRVEDYSFLGSIKDIELTPFGRDRARGRMVLVPPPDPHDDDGRTIAALTLEEVSRSIAERYSGSQLRTFLVESGIPSEDLAEEVSGSKWQFVQQTFLHLAEGGSSKRRALRHFLGEWLTDQLHTGPRSVEERDRLLNDLARQGWHLRDSSLVVGERVTPQRFKSGSGSAVFAAPSQGARPTDVFVLLPLRPPFTTIYRDLVVPAAEKEDMTCQHAGEIFGPGLIVSDVRYLIGEAKAIVADLTGRNPNVFYELGIAHALGRPVVQLTQEIDDVPFDIRHLRTLHYEWRDAWPPEELDRLRNRLAAHLRAATDAEI